MSKFNDDHLAVAERRQRAWEKRKEDAKYYRDLSKLSFGGLIIVEMVKFHEGEPNYYLLFLGAFTTVFLAVIANKILKK